MANEFKIKNGFLSTGDSQVTGSLTVSNGITGSLFGTASNAINAISSSITVGTTPIINGTDGRVFFQSGSTAQQDSNFFWDNTNKRLILGTTGFNGELQINRSTGGTNIGGVRANSAGGGTEIGGANNYTNKILLHNAQGIHFFTGTNTSDSSEKMRITTGTSWGVGIGTTSPSSRLHIQGSGATSATTALLVENANASASMVVLDNGNVGVGTNTPSELLDVSGSIKILDNSFIKFGVPTTYLGWGRRSFIQHIGDVAYSNLSIRWGSTSYSQQSGPEIYMADSIGGVYFRTNRGNQQGRIAIGNYSNNSSQDLVLLGGTTSYPSTRDLSQINAQENNLKINAYDYLSLGTRTSASLYISSSGNIGIGTTEPSASLHISGASSAALFEIDSPAVNNILFVSGSGNVGIGTATPSGQLQVGNYASNQNGIQINQGSINLSRAGQVQLSSIYGNYYGLIIKGNTGNNLSLYSGVGGNDLARFSGGVVGTTINDGANIRNVLDDGTGGAIFMNNVSISTTSSLARLHVRGSGATSATTALRVENVNASASLIVNDAGDVYNNGAGGVTSNTFYGENVGRSATGASNTFVGASAGLSSTTGTANVCIGRSAGRFISSGGNLTIANQSIFIGVDTRPNADNETNQIVIGHNAIGLGSNTTVIGNTSTTLFRPYGNVAIGKNTSNATLDVSGSATITGSLIVTEGITGSLFGTATTASFTPNALVTASVSSNTITFTKGDGTTFPITVDTGSGGAAFPFTGSAGITGSLIVTGSINSRLTVNNNLGFRQAETASYNLGTQNVGGTYRAVNFTGSVVHTTYNGSTDSRIGVSAGNSAIPSIGATIPSEIVGFTSETGSNYSSVFAQRIDTTAIGGGPTLQSGLLSIFNNNEQYEVRTDSNNRSLSIRKFDTTGRSIQLVLQGNETGFNLSNNLTSPSASLFKINNSTSNIIFETFQTGLTQVNGSFIATGSNGTINTDTSNLLSSNILSVDWGNRRLYDNSGLQTSLNWRSRNLFDYNESSSLDWNIRQLNNAASTPTVDWNNNILYDSNVVDSVNWDNRNLVDSNFKTSTDWRTRNLFDTNESSSLAWQARQLNNTSGNTVLTWLNGIEITKSTVITGSLRGNVSALSIASNTASLDMSTNNFFTLNLVNGADTHINPTNLQPGQTVNIRVNQDSAGTGTVSFPSFVDQPSGSAYTGSQVANAIDIVTMITFDSSLVFVSSVRNMI